jgi:metal-responsive CopG/Arc/MetJ family transcriptional regulator
MKKVLISMSDELLLDIDEHCKVNRYERSEFVRSLIRERIYFATAEKGQKVISPTLINKVKEAESKVEEAKKKTSKILGAPVKSSAGLYSFCPKHGTFYASCGCEPK